jgi:hypothetical protein
MLTPNMTKLLKQKQTKCKLPTSYIGNISIQKWWNGFIEGRDGNKDCKPAGHALSPSPGTGVFEWPWV